MDCIFCKIIEKEIPAEIIFENEDVIAFLDINPKSEGHTLVVPKNHYENIAEKNDDVDIIEHIKEIVDILKNKYGFQDFQVTTNSGSKAGQEVFHTHFHIIPFY